MRIESAPGGVHVEPLDEEIAPVAATLLGLGFDLAAFESFAAGHTPELAEVVERLRGYRPPISPDPFETLVTSITAQQVSLASAFAIRSRMIERFGERAVRAYAFPTRDRLAGADPAELTAVGFSGRKAEYVIGLARADLDYDALSAACGRGRQGSPRRRAGPRRVDGGLVPGTPPRPSAGVARGRPRTAQGRRCVLW